MPDGKEGRAVRVTALGAVAWLEHFSARIAAGEDPAAVLDELAAWVLKVRTRWGA